jgi:uncharacterized phage-associated protein
MPQFDESKALATILYLAQKAGVTIDLYSVVKLVYCADKMHLHEWGRTITGDKYAKMRYGPVPSATYDMLKAVRGDRDWERDLSSYFEVSGNKVTALIDPDRDEFSDSDIQCLDKVFAEHGHKAFDELVSSAHDVAFRSAAGHWISETDLAEGDPVLIDHIRDAADDEHFLSGW